MQPCSRWPGWLVAGTAAARRQARATLVHAPACLGLTCCCLLQEGLKPTEIEGYTAAQFRLADTEGTGAISYEDFVGYYKLLAISKARQELRAALGPQAESEPCCLLLAAAVTHCK